MLARIMSFIVVTLVFSSGVIARPGANVNAALIVESNDNIGNAAFEEDKRDDIITELRLSYRGNKLIQRPWILLYGIELKQSLHQDFDLLDATSLDLQLGLVHKSKNSFSAPVYSFTINLGTTDTEIDTRDVDYARIGLNYSRRITDRISFSTGLESYSQKPKEESIFDSFRNRSFANIFDLDNQRFFTNLDYKVNRKSTLYLTYSYITGDVVSVADDARNEFLDFRNSRIHDEAFGPRGQSRLYAYRLEADTNILNLGYNIAVGQQAAVDLSYQYIDSSVRNDINYEINRISLAYLHRF